MFHSCIINNKTNCLRERCLHLLSGDKSSSFKKLLEQDKFVANLNLQILAMEMFKVYRNISLAIFSEIFHRRDINYNLRINSDFAMPNVRSVSYGSESISYLGPKIWDIVPLELEELLLKVLLPSKKLLKGESRKTVHVGYVRSTYPI